MKCRVCKEPLGKLAMLAGDPYCSNTCCKLDHGLIGPEDAKQSQWRSKAGKTGFEGVGGWREKGSASYVAAQRASA